MIQKAVHLARVGPRVVSGRALGYAHRLHLKAVRHFGGEQPMSVRYWRNASVVLNRVFGVSDALFSNASTPSTDNALECEDLQHIAKYPLGGWMLEASAIGYLWQSLLTDQPSVLLECGSGVSTLILATYARKASKEAQQPTVVLSLDQNASYLAETESLLRSHDLDQYVQLFETPLDVRNAYDLSSASLQAALVRHKVDWVLVDGPSGPPGCREHTIPDLLPYCSAHAKWFLDDAFRDKELQILARWSEIPKLEIDGILPTGKGLARGTVNSRVIDFSLQ